MANPGPLVVTKAQIEEHSRYIDVLYIEYRFYMRGITFTIFSIQPPYNEYEEVNFSLQFQLNKSCLFL